MEILSQTEPEQNYFKRHKPNPKLQNKYIFTHINMMHTHHGGRVCTYFNEILSADEHSSGDSSSQFWPGMRDFQDISTVVLWAIWLVMVLLLRGVTSEQRV